MRYRLPWTRVRWKPFHLKKSSGASGSGSREVLIEYSDRAHADLENAIDNLWLVSREAAGRFAEEHDACMASLMAFPRLGSPGPGGHRSLLIGSSGYRLYNEIRGDTIRILALENVRRRGR